MAEQAVSTMASAVIGGITDRALTTVTRKLRSGSCPAAAHEKLQRLETLVLKLRCAVEVSEKHAIGSASLLEWRDKLRSAAEEGGAAVLDFQRRAREEGEAASTSAPVHVQHQQQPAAAPPPPRPALCISRGVLCSKKICNCYT